MWALVGHQTAVLERVVDFVLEFSVVAARGLDGAFAHYGAIENTHRDHILDLSVAPARVPPAAVAEAVTVTQAIMDELAYVGVLCVEFFLTADGKVLVNEIAPRPHNSGHLTIDACITSQFEQQVRAVCGLPLGSPALVRAAAMANLLGDVWQRRRAALGGGAGRARREAAPLRQARPAAGPQDGPSHRGGRHAGRRDSESARRPRRPPVIPELLMPSRYARRRLVLVLAVAVMVTAVVMIGGHPVHAQAAAVLAEIDRGMEHYRLDAHIPGMVWGIVKDGRLVHVKGAGVQDVESKRPVTADTLFRIASMTKAFTALSILKLRDDGKLVPRCAGRDLRARAARLAPAHRGLAEDPRARAPHPHRRTWSPTIRGATGRRRCPRRTSRGC